jgi:DNA polymerase elongation subunit (family B)
MLKTSYPEYSKKEIMKFLDKQIKDNIVDPTCMIDNNYINKSFRMTLLQLYDWIVKAKPICAGQGTFFKNQNQKKSVLAQMIDKILSNRKKFKDTLKYLDEHSYEYATNDRLQGSEKRNANSIYGSFGQVSSFIFNKYTAPSVTGTGRSLISTTLAAFERFLSNNNKFNNIDECMMYLYNISNEDKPEKSILPDIPLEKVEERLGSMFYGNRYDSKNADILHTYLESVSQTELNIIYFKNNLYEFSLLPEIKELLSKTISECESFRNPNNVPDTIQPYLKEIWDYMSIYVLYKYSPVDRIQRLKNDKRQSTVTVDTDSNMESLACWVEFMYDNIIPLEPSNMDKDRNELDYMCVNIMAYILTNMITEVLEKCTKDSNILKEYRPRINMKNEFLFTRMILSSKKKRYMSSVALREGKMFNPEKIDIKGLDFMKSTTSEKVKNVYIDILTRNVLHSKDIKLKGVLKEIGEFEQAIFTSLKKGEKEYLSPISVKELGAYADPFRGQGIRAVHAWNTIYPEMTITLPAKVDIVKLTLDDQRNLDKFMQDEPEIYAKVEKGILNSTEEKIAKKGLVVLAIPKNVEKVPDWAIPYIDYSTISYNVLNKVYPILNSLGFKTLKTSKREYFSNIVDI